MIPSSQTQRRASLVAAFAGWCLLPPASIATSYVITTTVDDTTVNGNCTLREALRAADTNLAVDACPAGGAADTITLSSGTYPFSGQEQLLGSGTLTIQSATGNPFTVSIDLGTTGRFLELGGAASYVLGGIEIKNGRAPAGNPVGGAIAAINVPLRIFNFRLVGNSVPGAGGALYFSGLAPSARLLVYSGSFLSNSVTAPIATSAQGGAAQAVVSGGATAEFRDVSFVGNSATDSSNPVAGGALSLQSSMNGSAARCVRCNFQSNSGSTTDAAGTDDVWGGAVMAGASSGGLVEVLDSRFTSNSASGGASAFKSAAIRGDASSGGIVRLERLFLDLNSAPIDSVSFDVELRTNGAASRTEFYDSQLTFGTASGLLAVTDSTVVLGHLTIADYAGYGLVSGATAGPGITLQNSIVALNDAGNIYVEPFTGGVVETTNFVGGDPLFLNEPSGDYHLSASSTAIGGGTNNVSSMRLADLDHHGRIVGAATDAGCYEFNGLFADDFEVGDAGSWSALAP